MSAATAWPDDRRITIRDLQHYPDPAHSYT
jgi:hypothetical protein